MIGEHEVLMYRDRTAGAWQPVTSNPGMNGAANPAVPAGWTQTPLGNGWLTVGDGTASSGKVPNFAGMFSAPNVSRISAAVTQFQVTARVKATGPPRVGVGLPPLPVRLNLRLKFADSAADANPVQATFTWKDLPGNGGWTDYTFTFNDPGTWPTFATKPYVQLAFEFGPADALVVDTMELKMRDPAAPVDLTCYCESVSIRHGRDNTTDQPEAASATFEMSSDPGDPLPVLDIGALVVVSTTVEDFTSTRFSGLITDVSHTWDDEGEDTPDLPVTQVIAVSQLADLGRRIVGDAPFPQELDGARVARVLTLAGTPPDPLWSDPGTVQILPRDIDARAALEVAYDAANSAGGLVWHTRAGEVRYADADHRRGAAVALVMDACDLFVAPEWKRNLDGLVNDVSLRYGVTPEGGEQPEYRANNAASILARGRYAASITTDLADAAAAAAYGQLLLVRNATPVWVLSDMPVSVEDLDHDRTQALLGLELGSLLNLTGLPAVGGAPTSALLWAEGWSEVLTDGGHEFSLWASGYCRSSPAPHWDDTPPAWTWDTAPGTWDDATCMGPQPNLGRWDDVPASTRWDQIPPTTTWDTAA